MDGLVLVCYVAGNVVGWAFGSWLGDKIIERRERKRRKEQDNG